MSNQKQKRQLILQGRNLWHLGRLIVWWFKTIFCLLVGSLFFCAPSYAYQTSPVNGNLCEAEMVSAAQNYDVPLGILYAVGLTETGRKSSLQPFALNIEGKAVFADSAKEAERIFIAARKRGAKLIDLGCMQINHHFHGEHFASVQNMLDPKANVAYAAKFLHQLYQREGSWTMAVARYHAGPNNNPAQQRYVCRVIRNMIASGFGEWTKQAQDFCLTTS